MERVIVTVQRQGEIRSRDLEVPAEVEADRLAELIAAALHWDIDALGQKIPYQIEIRPSGRRLQPGETLASAGAWDGAWLILHPVRDVRAGWGRFRPIVSLGQPVSTVDVAMQQPTPKPKRRDSGYVWKQLD